MQIEINERAMAVAIILAENLDIDCKYYIHCANPNTGIDHCSRLKFEDGSPVTCDGCNGKVRDCTRTEIVLKKGGE